jgi:hypothetical protein
VVERVKLTGFRELEQTLLGLPSAVAKRIGRKALRDGGKPILEKYKARTKVKSGHLQESEVMGTRLNRRQRKLTPKPGASVIELHIGTTDPAGIQEEFGIRQAANPSLTPAWDSEGGTTAIDRIGKSLGDGIERQAKRDAKKAG